MGTKKKGRPPSEFPKEARIWAKTSMLAWEKWLRETPRPPLNRLLLDEQCKPVLDDEGKAVPVLKTQEEIAEALGINVAALKAAVKQDADLRRLVVRPDGRYEVKVVDLFVAFHLHRAGTSSRKSRAALVREAVRRRAKTPGCARWARRPKQ